MARDRQVREGRQRPRIRSSPIAKQERSKEPEVTSVEGRENGDRRPRVQKHGRLGRSEVGVIRSQYVTGRGNTMEIRTLYGLAGMWLYRIKRLFGPCSRALEEPMPATARWRCPSNNFSNAPAARQRRHQKTTSYLLRFSNFRPSSSNRAEPLRAG